MSDFEVRYLEYQDIVEQTFPLYLPDTPLPQARLLEAMRYSLDAGGKRIRPILLLEFCRVCGGRVEDALPFACALELIHTYSLIHDDLPCMDDDELRRGKPSNHMVFGENTAVLAGDALLTAAFEIMLDRSNTKATSAETVLAAAHAIARSAGYLGMVGGQQLDIENTADSENDVMRIHLLKTGALFEAAVKAGCLLGGASQPQVDAGIQFAGFLGLAFQIQDDILGAAGSEAELGKSIGIDGDKLTFVSLFGLSACRETVETLTQQALDCLTLFDDTEFLRLLCGQMAVRSR